MYQATVFVGFSAQQFAPGEARDSGGIVPNNRQTASAGRSFTMAAHSGLAGIASAFVFNPRLSNGRDSSTDGTLLAVLYPSELPRNQGLYRVAFLEPTNEDPRDLHS